MGLAGVHVLVLLVILLVVVLVVVGLVHLVVRKSVAAGIRDGRRAVPKDDGR